MLSVNMCIKFISAKKDSIKGTVYTVPLLCKVYNNIESKGSLCGSACIVYYVAMS